MTEQTAPLWVPEHDYLPPEDRSVIRALRLSPGVIDWRDFVVSPTVPASWNVKVGPGRAIVDGSTNPWTQGSYVCYAPDEAVLAVEPSNPSLDRVDLVVIHVHDQDNSTEQGFSWDREIVTGTPGSGLAPAAPPNSMPLQALLIKAGSTAVTAESWGQPIPPWYGDLRRSSGPVLLMMTDAFTSSVSYGWNEMMRWDLSRTQPPYTGLVGWDFPTLMEIQVAGKIVGPGPEAMNVVLHYKDQTDRWDIQHADFENQPGGLNLWYSFFAIVPLDAGQVPHIFMQHGANLPGSFCMAMVGLRVTPRWAGSTWLHIGYLGDWWPGYTPDKPSPFGSARP